jgi:hypothetical protein
MYAVKVGGLYDPNMRRWPEGAAWIYHQGRHELVLRFDDPSAAEIAAVAAGAGAVAFFEHGAVLLGLYRFGEGAIEWSDVPMEPHAWNAMPSGEQVPIAFVLLDASTGIVRALRVLLLPSGFATALATAARKARDSYDPQRWQADIAAASAAFSSEQMSKLATHVAEHGPKAPAVKA